MVSTLLLVAAAALGAPAIHAPGPSIRDMVELTDLSSVSISPDGRTVIFRAETASIERNDYDLEWYAVPSDGSAPPRRLAGAGRGDWPSGVLPAQPPIWSADGRWIYYRALIDGAVEIWRTSADGALNEQETHDPANVTGFTIASNTGTMVYTVGAAREDVLRAEQAEYDGGIQIDAHVDPALALFRGSRIDGRLASERLTGFWFAHGGLLATQPLRYRAIDPGSTVDRPASEAEQALVKPPVRPFDRIDGRQILARIDSGDARGSAYLLALGVHGEIAVTKVASTTDATVCVRPQCLEHTILSASWQPGANAIVFTTSDGDGNDDLNLWDVGSGAVRTIAAGLGLLNGGRDSGLGCAASRDAVVCVAAAANEPPRLMRFDLASGQATVLADPNATLRRAGEPEFAALAWHDAQGTAFNGQLLLPHDRPAKVPLFVTYYVCDGYLRGGTGDEFPLRQLANRGIAVLCINRPPAAPGFGDQLDHYRIALAGITSAIDLLAQRGIIDRNRVGMGGLSFGGEVTAWVLTHSDLLAAASISSSLLTPTYYWFNALAGRDTPEVLQKVWHIGDPDSDAARWQAISPALNAAKIAAPLLMQLPEQEFRFNLELAARMNRGSTPVELWAFSNETHVKYQPRHKLAVYTRNLDWFDYWLNGKSDPDPAKAKQTARWQAFAKRPGWHDAAMPGASQGSPSHDRSQTSTSASVSTR